MTEHAMNTSTADTRIGSHSDINGTVGTIFFLLVFGQSERSLTLDLRVRFVMKWSEENVAESTAVVPPIEPMLAKLVDSLPEGAGFLYEPKWDGFRAIVFRGDDDVYIQSRDLRPLDRYFPELHDVLLERLPAGCVVDGEIVIVTPHGLDFDALQLRLHPAASRVAKLARESPASFVAFDLLALDGRDLRGLPQSERRAL